MTDLQFRRWIHFAIRFAWRGWTGLPKKSRRRTLDMVKGFFRHMVNYAPWTEGNGSDLSGLRNRIVSWDETDNSGEPKDGYGHTPIGPLVCDMMTEFLSDENPYYHHRGNYEYERWDERWGARVRCSVRAGIDMASEPSAGVVGFTVGDLRRVFRGMIPSWVTKGFKDENEKPIDLNDCKDDEGVWL